MTPPTPLFVLLLGGTLSLAAGLRVAALPAEPWFDEVWSWELARAAEAPWAVVRLRHDNSHPLNTLYLHACPEGLPWPYYRLHSLLAGVAAVAVAAWLGARRGRAEAVAAALLLATDYWLVLASAEARGYSLGVLFALAALAALGRYLDGGGWASLGVFWAAVALGFLSHLTFLHAYLGLLAWSVYHFARRRTSPGDELVQALRCHGVPAAFLAGYYLLAVRGMTLGGGPPASTAEVLGRLVGLGMGGPGAGPLAALAVLAAAVLFAVGLRLLARGGSGWVFFAVAVFVSPALFLLGRPPFLFERYFLISFVFFLLLLGFVLGAGWRRGGVCRAASAAVLAVVVLGNLGHVRGFLAGGRGRFSEALAYVYRHDDGGVICLTPDDEFRVRKFCAFHAPQLGDPRPIEYRARGGRWLLLHRLDERFPPGEVVRDGAGAEYVQVWAAPARGPACWGWYVYRRGDEAPSGR